MTNTAVTVSKLPSLLLFTSSVALVAAFGAQFEPGAWYSQLQKPDWNPPNWVFGPVWTLLQRRGQLALRAASGMS